MSEVKPREFWIIEDDSFLLTVSRNKPDEPYRIFHVIEAKPVLARIAELENDLANRAGQVHWKNIEIDTLEKKLAFAVCCARSGETFTDEELRAIK